MSNPTIHDLVRDQASIRPDAIAVSTAGTTITYRQLDQWSDRVAARITAAGLGDGDTIAVAIERSVAYPVAVLGVLKAGYGYLPLDRDYPAERVNLILTASDASALLVHDPDHADGAPILPIVLPGLTEDTPPAGKLPTVSDRNLANVIYTSGSTGRPKGVLVEHRQVVSLIQRDQRLHVQPGDRVMMFAPPTFDASTFELWGSLCRGGELVVIERDVRSVVEIGARVRSIHPDWLWLTAGIFHLLAEHDPAAFDSVGTLITGGDVLSPRHFRQIANRGTARVLAGYGPTETTTFASLHVARPGQELPTVPIGRPLRGTRMQVLDKHGQPVTPGEVGELYITGPGVARGYRDADPVMQQRFAATASGRRYRTGDLVRELPNGEFEFCGRVDRQVKIRGFRIEPGEIETTLVSSPKVSAAVATAVDGGHGKRLVTYYVPAAGCRVSTPELRSWLADRLPSYLHPSTFVELSALPLDVNGKPDRRALPYPWSRRDEISALPPYRRPVSPMEVAISAVWEEVLGLDRVGLDDDFYELGGDSLHSVDVLARLRRDGIAISARLFFEHPTVAELAMAHADD